MQFRAILTGAVALAALALLSPAVRAEGWGDIKGQVVWGPKDLPKEVPAGVNKDQAHCLSKGPIFTEDYVVNPKNRGVRWALVYLVDASKPTAALPIHPSLKNVPNKPAVIDQPCCKFEPRVLAVREGQKVEVKNPAPVAHNFKIDGGALGPNINPLMPPNCTPVVIDSIPARKLPVPFSCSIHPWMKGWVASFKHPYFAVTDVDGKFSIPKAPAGKYRLMVWQDSVGYVNKDPKDGKYGAVIEIKADAPNEVGAISLEPRKE